MMQVGDLVRYRRGSDEWVGVVMQIWTERPFGGDPIQLVNVVIDESVQTYKYWKLEVIHEKN